MRVFVGGEGTEREIDRKVESYEEGGKRETVLNLFV